MRPPRKHPSRLVLVGGFRYLRQLLHQGAKTRDGLGLYHFWTTLTFTFTLSAMRACTAYLVISSLLFLFNLSLYLNLILLLGLLYVVSSSYY